MLGKRTSVRKIREILRLHSGDDWSLRGITVSVNVSPTTVSECLSRTKLVGLNWPLPDELLELDSTPTLPCRSRKHSY